MVQLDHVHTAGRNRVVIPVSGRRDGRLHAGGALPAGGQVAA
ncbi:MAG: hypothetical protein QGH45_22865 [Myxococcota bacterium]|nr:hypothetical protein [Myxococcota bacterium]